MSIFQKALCGLIRLYKRFISPGLGRNCRFSPSCSQYGIEAIRTHGCLKGLLLTAGQRAGSTGAATSGAAGRDLTGADEAWLRTAGTATIDAGTPTHATVTPEPGEGPNGSVDGILSGADVEHSKPAPDCFLEAMRREGCTPQETLIFEDSEIGLEAARRSGAAYFRVTL